MFFLWKTTLLGEACKVRWDDLEGVILGGMEAQSFKEDLDEYVEYSTADI